MGRFSIFEFIGCIKHWKSRKRCRWIVVSVTVALYTTHLVRDLPSSVQEFFFCFFFFFFADSYIVSYLELILSFCAVVVSGGCYWRLSV